MVQITKSYNRLRAKQLHVGALGNNTFELTALPFSATITVGTEAANVINVAVQLTDATGVNVTDTYQLECYLSDQADGSDVTAAVPDADVVIGTNGTILFEHVTDAVFVIQTNSSGAFDFDISDTVGTPTWYLVVRLPNGTQVISDAITFA